VTRGRAQARAFYARDALDVAPALLNKVLVHDGPDGRCAMRIVEVEAYRGADDPASHAFRGPTRRNATMFGPPGHLYVYFTYGMHWCANVVTGTRGAANAVLLRAGAPLEGLAAMRARRPAARRERELGAGPARLAAALGITGADDGADLVRGPLRILDDGVAPPAAPEWTPRVGIREGRGHDHPWRCLVPGDVHASRTGPVRPRTRR
jgi:DNA-3-methyladenine glycosylase